MLLLFYPKYWPIQPFKISWTDYSALSSGQRCPIQTGSKVASSMLSFSPVSIGIAYCNIVQTRKVVKRASGKWSCYSLACLCMFREPRKRGAYMCLVVHVHTATPKPRHMFTWRQMPMLVRSKSSIIFVVWCVKFHSAGGAYFQLKRALSHPSCTLTSVKHM